MTERPGPGGLPDDDPSVDTRRWLRDLSALLALPALWVDHEPREIATGLLSVLFGVLQLDGAYARFDDGDDETLEVWRPSGPRPPTGLLELATPDRGDGALESRPLGGTGTGRAATLPLALPWGSGTVVVSAPRADFPTAIETQLLRVAVGQAAIAIHTARRLARETDARRAAEQALHHQRRLLRSLVDEVAPELSGLARYLREAAHEAAQEAEPEPASGKQRETAPGQATGGDGRSSSAALTRREVEVLGLLAQGLSNKEIAGVLWLSDRTVERHITSLYRKIGVARRSEATAFALRHGVV
ncbi:response regulator transcription factor [uncultured Leifsonia sp.]|uniref:helix-turn-helix transcriptional regulator n=1 Tax=uncultured Leifsonia sp. TaxID=340359 RepID=UPI0025CF1D6D|nr:response regulator transcription factor [uncultured Leifsonia sp.]